MDYTCQLPIDLFIPIVFHSFDTQDPVRRLIRTEELRLVNRAWRAAIDCTPLLWTCVPNDAVSFPEKVPDWIKKSGEVPLHILSTNIDRPLETYMELVRPLSHRWQKLEIKTSIGSIAEYLNEPTPMLETLIVSYTSLCSVNGLFGGITPLLSSVHLVCVILPETTSFLRNLRELRLDKVHNPSGSISIAKLHDTLSACPDLEQLELDAYYHNHQFERPPVLLANLRSFKFRGALGPLGPKDVILGMITAPRLANVSIRSGRNWAPVLNVLSPLSTEVLLREHTKYHISISHRHFALSTIDEQENVQDSPSVMVDLSNYPYTRIVALTLFKSFEKAAPLSCTMDMVFDQSRSTRNIFKYLKSTIGGMDGVSGHPLPQIRSIRLNIDRESSHSYQDLLKDLAQ
ncbi:hypothetical protein FRC01_011234, partial [Tulasnella sp. 417]